MGNPTAASAAPGSTAASAAAANTAASPAAVTLEELRHNPYDALAALRAQTPVAWVPAIDAWLVTRRDLAIEVLRDDATYTVDDERFSTRRILGDNMLANDGETHARHRGAFAAWFRPSAIATTMQPWLDEHARDLVAALGRAGTTDAATCLAAPFAVDTIAHFFSLHDADAGAMLEWYRTFLAAFDAVSEGEPVPTSAGEAYRRLDAVVRDTIDAVPDSLLAAVADADLLNDDEIVANVAVSLFGAIETSEGMTATALAYLLADPGLVDAVRQDRSLLGGVIEESLRVEPAVNIVDRYTTRSVVLGGVELARGAYVSVSLLAANRDPDTFGDPDRFDPHRTNARAHLSFVQGPHTCLGLHLARAETTAMLSALLDRFGSIELDREASQPPDGWVFRKPRSVVMGFEI